MKTTALIAASMLAVAFVAPVTATFAETNMVAAGDSEMQALAGVKVSAADAVTAAETASGARVGELSLDMEGTTPTYRVTTVAQDGTETNYLVDAVTGKAVLFVEDKPESNDPADNGEGADEGQDNGAEGEDAN